MSRSAAELEGLLAVAEHRRECADIRAESAERRYRDTVEAYNRLVEQYNRVWADLVPADVPWRCLVTEPREPGRWLPEPGKVISTALHEQGAQFPNIGAMRVLEALREAGYEVAKAPTPEQQLVTAVQAAVLKTCNGIGAALLGNSFTPLTVSPISDDELIRMFREASHDQ